MTENYIYKIVKDFQDRRSWDRNKKASRSIIKSKKHIPNIPNHNNSPLHFLSPTYTLVPVQNFKYIVPVQNLWHTPKQRLENKTEYLYRVKSKRIGTSFKKERIYLGKNLKGMSKLIEIDKADKILNKTKISDNIKKIKPIILKILKQYKIKKAGIFGSYSVGENTKNSDIDILIEPAKGMGLELVGLQLDLSNSLNKKVDIVSYKYIHPRLKERVLSQEIKIS